MSPLTIPFAKSVTSVGSRITCNPPPLDTDRDWLVLVDAASENDLWKAPSEDGWEMGGSLPDDENNTPADLRFTSFTKGIENLIVTSSELFHRRFIAATDVARLLNIMDKAHRIALFQAVLYANKVDPWKVDPWCSWETHKAGWPEHQA
jgi:hypothetical protein